MSKKNYKTFEKITSVPVEKKGGDGPVWVYQEKNYKTFEKACEARIQSLEESGLDPANYPLPDYLINKFEHIIFDPLIGSPWLMQDEKLTKQRAFPEENGKTLTVKIEYTISGASNSDLSPLFRTEHLGVMVNPALEIPDETSLYGQFQTCSGSIKSDLIIVVISNVPGDATLFWFKSRGQEPIWSCAKVFESGEQFYFRAMDENKEVLMQHSFNNGPGFKELRLQLKGHR